VPKLNFLAAKPSHSLAKSTAAKPIFFSWLVANLAAYIAEELLSSRAMWRQPAKPVTVTPLDPVVQNCSVVLMRVTIHCVLFFPHMQADY